MNIRVKKEQLLEQLQLVARVAATRASIQALSGVKLLASEAGVELQATDMEVSLRVPVEATIGQLVDVEQNNEQSGGVQPGEVEASRAGLGEVVLPSRLFLDVVRSLPAADVNIRLRDAEQDVEILSGSAKFHIRVLRNEDFPQLPARGGEAITVSASHFAQTIQRVARAASRDEARPVLTGILVSASGHQLRMVATDSYRLSVKETQLESALSGDFEANVPARALQELARIIEAKDTEQLSVSLQQNQVVFEVGAVMLASRLIDGQFPNYRQLLPDTYEHELEINGAELMEVVRRISLLAQKNAPLRLALKEGELTVSAQTPDVGEATETVPVPFTGEPLEIGFNADYFRDGLESVESSEVKLKLISPLRPGLIQASNNGGFFYLVMPIRLNN